VLFDIPGLPAEAQFRSVVLLDYDGEGNYTSLEHTVVNGTPLGPDWTTGNQTYSVNPNCTGTALLNTPNSPAPLKVFFVLVREGKETHTILDGNAITTVGIKVE